MTIELAFLAGLVIGGSIGFLIQLTIKLEPIPVSELGAAPKFQRILRILVERPQKVRE